MATAVLTRMGNSVGVVIPKEYRGAGFQQGDHVTIERRDGSLVITPIDEPMTLKSLMRNYKGEKPEFIDPGASVGRELW